MSADSKAWKELSARTGMEPQRKPTGFGLKISSLPTHWSSLEPSVVDGGFSMEIFKLQVD